MLENKEKNMELKEKALQLGKTLKEYKGLDVVVLDLTAKNTWTDYFIITTCTSAAHSDGLERHILEEAEKLELDKRKRTRKNDDGEDWKLIDLNEIVIHIMSDVARKFYDLEKLMFDATTLEIAD